jgi:hypothetical protein
MKITFAKIEELIAEAQRPIDVGWLEKAPGEHHNYHRFLYLLSMYMKPRVAVEIGVFHGLGSQHLGEAARRHGGVAIGIDNGTLLDYDVSAPMTTNFQTKPTPKSPFRVNPINFQFILGESTDQRVLDKVASYGKIDLMYHDSHASYLLAKKEWAAWRPLMSDEGLWISDHLYQIRAFDGDPPDKDMWTFFQETEGGEKKTYKDVLQTGITQGMIIL